MSDNIKDRVLKVICRHKDFDKELSEVKLDARLTEDIGMDSLARVELVMALEEEFGCEIEDKEAEKIKTIQDIISYIEEQEQKQLHK